MRQQHTWPVSPCTSVALRGSSMQMIHTVSSGGAGEGAGGVGILVDGPTLGPLLLEAAPKAAPIIPSSCRTICSMTLGVASAMASLQESLGDATGGSSSGGGGCTAARAAAARRSRCSCCSCSARDAEMASASSSSSCSRFLACLSLGHRPVGCPFVGCRGLSPRRGGQATPPCQPRGLSTSPSRSFRR